MSAKNILIACGVFFVLMSFLVCCDMLPGRAIVVNIAAFGACSLIASVIFYYAGTMPRAKLDMGRYRVVTQPHRHVSDGPVHVHLCHLPKPNSGASEDLVSAYVLGLGWQADAIMKMKVGYAFEYCFPESSDFAFPVIRPYAS